jgi:TetR/AcrR family transcriptional regulator
VTKTTGLPSVSSSHQAGRCVFYANGHENLKHLDPQRDLLSPELIEQYTQAAINLVLSGVLHQEK